MSRGVESARTWAIQSAFVDALRRARATELGGFASDTVYVGAWQGAATVADLLQIALLVRVLGLEEYGEFALVVAFVTLVGQFFDLRMTTATTAVAAPHLVAERRRAEAIFRFSYWVDGIVGLIALCTVLALAPVLGPRLVGSDSVQWISLYALVLVISSPDDTSITILRLLDRFRLAAVCGIAAEGMRVILIFGALAIRPELTYAIGALVVASVGRTFINARAASRAASAWLPGARLFRRARLPKHDRREILAMLFHTNVASYARLAMTQLPTLLLGAIAGAAQVGAYKVGMAIAAGIGRLADPATSAIFPRIARLWENGRNGAAKLLVYRATCAALVVLGTAVALVVLFKDELARLILGSEPSAAIGTVVIIASVGQAINGVLFWNAQALFAAHRARAVALVTLFGAAAQAVVLVVLAPRSGATGAAIAFLVAQVVINVGLTAMALRVLRSPHRQQVVAARPAMSGVAQHDEHNLAQ